MSRAVRVEVDSDGKLYVTAEAGLFFEPNGDLQWRQFLLVRMVPTSDIVHSVYTFPSSFLVTVTLLALYLS